MPVIVYNTKNIAEWTEELNAILATQHLGDRTERQTQLEQNIADGKLFLNTLKNNPNQFVLDIVQYIEEKLDNFDCVHAANQSIVLRRSITNIRRSLDNIMAVHTATDAVKARETYAKICGLISTIYNDLAQMSKRTELEEAFLQRINLMLEMTHVNFNSDLPDDMRIGKRSFYYFRENCKQVSDATLDKQEQDEYATHFNRLYKRFIDFKPATYDEAQCKKTGLAMLTRIRDEKITAEKKQAPFDIKYATTVLKKTNALIDKPLDTKLQAQYQQIADCKGKPSPSSAIGNGLYFALWGIMMIVACAVSFPQIVWLATATGLPIGLEVLTGSLLTIEGVTGAAVFGAGCFSIYSAFRHGLSKNMVDFAQAEKTMHTPKPAGTPATREEHPIPKSYGWMR